MSECVPENHTSFTLTGAGECECGDASVPGALAAASCGPEDNGSPAVFGTTEAGEDGSEAMSVIERIRTCWRTTRSRCLTR